MLLPPVRLPLPLLLLLLLVCPVGGGGVRLVPERSRVAR